MLKQDVRKKKTLWEYNFQITEHQRSREKIPKKKPEETNTSPEEQRLKITSNLSETMQAKESEVKYLKCRENPSSWNSLL